MTKSLHSTPFALSLSKGHYRQYLHFDKLSANVSIKGVLFS